MATLNQALERLQDFLADDRHYNCSEARSRALALLNRIIAKDFKEPDHDKILAVIKAELDKAKTTDTILYREYEKVLQMISVALREKESVQAFFRQLEGQLKYGTSFSECPKIPEAAEMITRTKEHLAREHPKDTNLSEVAAIGHDYTFHTHPRGTVQPSEADIETTRNLNKASLCIGLVPQNKVICYDSQTLQKTCEHPA